MKINVCVIGAGAAGLAAARRLASQPQKFDFVVYEQNSNIGGQWLYDEKINSNQFHSSMYKNMRTNLPKEVMGFPEFPFPSGGNSFIHHTEVQRYLQRFTEHYSLRKFLKLAHEVKEVKPIRIDTLDKWIVSVVDRQDNHLYQKQFDSVMVCNGSYSKPFMPDFPGMEKFSGKIIHSHYYKDNSSFKDKVVVCLGRGPSGSDISLEISQVAKKVIISHNKAQFESLLPENTSQAPGIASLDESYVHFLDGHKEKVDCIMLCTGYLYDFHFLHKDCQIKVEDHRVTNFYQHLINIHYPTLAIFGIPFIICPFPFFDTQVLFYLKFLSGSLELPSKKEMLKQEKEEYEERLKSGLVHRYAHRMASLQWLYHDKMYKLAGEEGNAMPQILRELYDYVHETRVKDLMNYKKLSYVIENDRFELLDNQGLN